MLGEVSTPGKTVVEDASSHSPQRCEAALPSSCMQEIISVLKMLRNDSGVSLLDELTAVWLLSCSSLLSHGSESEPSAELRWNHD